MSQLRRLAERRELEPSVCLLCDSRCRSKHNARSDQSLPHPPPHRRPSIHGQGVPRSHGPTEDIVNHQVVNVRLTLHLATAAEADEKFGGISGESRSCHERLARCPMRQVAHFCVTLAAQRHWNRRFQHRLAENQWLNRRPGPGSSGRTFATKVEPHQFGANHPQTWSSTAPRRLSPFVPARRPFAPFDLR